MKSQILTLFNSNIACREVFIFRSIAQSPVYMCAIEHKRDWKGVRKGETEKKRNGRKTRLCVGAEK